METPLPEADELHTIPSAYFKVVYDATGNAASFIFDQDLPKQTDYCALKISNKELNSKIPFVMPKFTDSEKILKR